MTDLCLTGLLDAVMDSEISKTVIRFGLPFWEVGQAPGLS